VQDASASDRGSSPAQRLRDALPVAGAASAFGLSRRFLDTKRWLPRFDTVWILPALLMAASLLLGFMNVRVWNVLAYLGDCLTAPLGLIAAWLRLRQGQRSARWFLLAQMILGVGMLLQTGFDFDFSIVYMDFSPIC
jgi:hypothetical protein